MVCQVFAAASLASIGPCRGLAKIVDHDGKEFDAGRGGRTYSKKRTAKSEGQRTCSPMRQLSACWSRRYLFDAITVTSTALAPPATRGAIRLSLYYHQLSGSCR